MHAKLTTVANELPVNVRCIEGVGWQVLIEAPYQWHCCRSEQDAQFISSGLRMAARVVSGVATGKEVAEDLDAVTAVAIRVLGYAAAQPLVDAAALARLDQNALQAS